MKTVVEIGTGSRGNSPRATQAERSARTRAALLKAARELFAEKGFAGTGREEIAERAGVTRGALYHHFDSKTDLAAAVVDELQAELVDLVVAAALRGKGVREQLHLGCRAYMDASADPTMARILADAPAVLGIAHCRSLDAAACVPLLEQVFAEARVEGIEVPGDPTIVATLLLGMLNEGAAVIAAAPRDTALRDRVCQSVDLFLTKIFG
jgi:AcrR family transcriptional regulator